MVREVKTTITKRSARQMRSLEADSDQEFQQAEATPLDTSIDQKKNYAVDGLVAALDKLNPAVGAIFQKKNAIARDKDAKAGTAAGLMGKELQGDESERHKENFFAAVAHNEAGKATVDLEQAQATRDRTVPYATWIAEQRAKAEADMAGESDSYKISYMTRYDASLERVRQGEIAKQKEEIAETQSAMLSETLEDTITAAKLDDTTVTPANLSTLRQGFLAQGMNKKTINDNFIATAIDIAARTGDTSLLDTLSQPTVDGTPGIAGQNQYKTRVTTARKVAAAYNKANDEKTLAEIKAEHRAETIDIFEPIHRRAAKGGENIDDLVAELWSNADSYGSTDLLREDIKKLIASDSEHKSDPRAVQEWKEAIEAGSYVDRSILLADPDIEPNDVDALLKHAEIDHSDGNKIKNSQTFKDGLSDLTASFAASVKGQGASKETGAILSPKKAEYIQRRIDMAKWGYQNEMTRQQHPISEEKADAILDKWDIRGNANIKKWVSGQKMEQDLSIVWTTRAHYKRALKNEYVPKYLQEIHEEYLARVEPIVPPVTMPEKKKSFDDKSFSSTKNYNTP